MAAIETQVFFSVEATPGTEQAVVGTDAVDCDRCDFRAEGERTQRAAIRPYQDRPAPRRPHAKRWAIDLAGEVKAATAAGTAPELSALLRAAGFKETVNVGVSVVYDLATDPNASPDATSLTVRKEQTVDGLTWVGIGARIGALELTSDFEGGLMWSGKALAGYKTPANQGAATSPTANTGTPLVLLDVAGTPFQAHTYSAVIESVRLNLATAARPRPHMGASNGYKLPFLLNRDRTSPVEGEFTCEMEDETAFDFWARWEGQTVANSQATWKAGSRAVLATMRNMSFGAPVPVSGFPDKYRVPFTLHGTGGSAGALSLTFT